MDINSEQINSKYALHDAVGNNDIESVQQQLLNGTNVDVLDKDGRTALLIAADEDFVAIAEVLLVHGADPNRIDSFETALCVAVKNGSLTLTKLLLKHGANPNFLIHGNLSYTALHVAVTYGFIDLAKILLEHNADPNLTCFRGNSVLSLLRYYTTEQISVGLLSLLLDYLACPNIKNKRGESALHRAVHYDNVIMVKKLVACGADPNSTDYDGDSILHVACRRRNNYKDRTTIVKTLLVAGANVAFTDKHGCTPLHLNPNKDFALCLLDKGASIDVQDNFGRTPLHCCLVDYYSGNATEHLLFAGANLDTPDNQGNTCIQMFEQKMYRPELNIILLKFAELNIKRKVTSRFDLNRIISRDFNRQIHEEHKQMYDQLEKVKYTNIEDVCLYNVLTFNAKDLSFLQNKAFIVAIEGDNFMNEFPHFYILTRMCVREAVLLKQLVEELSQPFAFMLSKQLVLNVPEEVCRLIIIELESEDMVNLKIALFC